MKKFFPWLLAVIFILSGCTSTPDSHSGASQQADWSISLSGFRTDSFNSWQHEKVFTKSPLGSQFQTVKKGENRLYEGIPFSVLAGIVDDDSSRNFNGSLWKEGYEVTITAADGYSATFSTKDVDPKTLLVCTILNGEAQPPTLAGPVSSKLWIKDIAKIELGLEKAASNTFQMTLEVGAVSYNFSIPDLEKSPFFWEAKGGYTTSAGTHYEGVYGGIKLPDFLKKHAALKPGKKVTMIAMDGYEMTYSSDDLLDTTKGTWTLGFRLDGEYLPEDPGFFRTIKLGAMNPDIPGHSSARMVKTIKVSPGTYKEFALKVSGQMSRTLDRSTVESGVSCHRAEVNYTKKGNTVTYTGIPLWRLLAYGDDPSFAPHKQDSSIRSYNDDAALEGYEIELIAADGFSVKLNSQFAHLNDKLIVALYGSTEELPEKHWPLRLVWDDALTVPDGLKSIGQLREIRLAR